MIYGRLGLRKGRREVKGRLRGERDYEDFVYLMGEGRGLGWWKGCDAAGGARATDVSKDDQND